MSANHSTILILGTTPTRPIKTAATAIIYQQKFKKFMSNEVTNSAAEMNHHAVDVNLALDRDDEVRPTVQYTYPFI
jgi:hypothetical protein